MAPKLSKTDTEHVRSNPEPEKAPRVHRIVVPTYLVSLEHRTASVATRQDDGTRDFGLMYLVNC